MKFENSENAPQSIFGLFGSDRGGSFVDSVYKHVNGA